jgi:YD repeat-containing protein
MPGIARSKRAIFGLALLGVSITTTAYAANGSVAYTYDSLGRIITTLYDTGICIVYAYDANGNRTSQTINVGGTPTTSTWGSGVWGCFNWSP